MLDFYKKKMSLKKIKIIKNYSFDKEENVSMKRHKLSFLLKKKRYINNDHINKKDKIPDAFIFFNVQYNYWFLNECKLFNIPVISFIDANLYYFNIDYPIPLSINKNNELFFFNYFLRLIYIGYKKIIIKLNTNKINIKDKTTYAYIYKK